MAYVLPQAVSTFDTRDTPTLSTGLYDGQKRDIVDLRTLERTHNAAIYVRQCGWGKTLALITACEGVRVAAEPCTLVISPLAATGSWEKDFRDHFHPPVSYLLLSSANKTRYSIRSLRRVHFVVINYDMLASAYGNALKFREQLIDEELRKLRTQLNTTNADTRHMTDAEKATYSALVQKIRDLIAYDDLHRASPNLHIPIPEQFSYLREKEAVLNTDTAFLALFRFRFHRIIVDEAHEARNEGNNFQAIRQLKFSNCFVVTATPCNNSIGDLIALLRIVKRDPPCGWKTLKCDKAECAIYLQEQCRNLFVGHSSGTLAEQMQEYKTTTVMVNVPFLTRREHDRYEQIQKLWESRDTDLLTQGPQTYRAQHAHNILQTITALRRACDGKTKLDAVCGYISQVVAPRREKAVAFVAFLDTTETLAKRVREKHKGVVRVFVITGRTPMARRTKIMDEFTRHRGSALLVATSRTIHLGVNLRTANHALVLNPWWNPVLEHQSVWRINRRLQTRSTFFVYFVMHDTVEESIWLVAQLKADMNTRVMKADIDETMLETVTSRSAMQVVSEDDASADEPVARNSRFLDPVVRCDNQVLIRELREEDRHSGCVRAAMKKRMHVVVTTLQGIVTGVPSTKTIYTPAPLQPILAASSVQRPTFGVPAQHLLVRTEKIGRKPKRKMQFIQLDTHPSSAAAPKKTKPSASPVSLPPSVKIVSAPSYFQQPTRIRDTLSDMESAFL